jgi:dUTP pyrophosphatase
MSGKLHYKKLHPDAIAPMRGSAKASGLDLSALEDTIIPAGKRVAVKTGIAFEIPDGLEIQVRPRSGLSLKTSLTIPNSPGTIDQDYTGECAVILFNSSPNEDYTVKRGDRIGQAVLCPVIIFEPELVEEIASHDRGLAGFGSTGK